MIHNFFSNIWNLCSNIQHDTENVISCILCDKSFLTLPFVVHDQTDILEDKCIT